MQHVAYAEPFIIAGVFSSTISSALGQLDGSARVLQTLARDDIIPSLKIFQVPCDAIHISYTNYIIITAKGGESPPQ